MASPQILAIVTAPAGLLVFTISVVSLVCLVALGATAARTGGAAAAVGARRVVLWGVLAMAGTPAIGRLFGTGAP